METSTATNTPTTMPTTAPVASPLSDSSGARVIVGSGADCGGVVNNLVGVITITVIKRITITATIIYVCTKLILLSMTVFNSS